MAHLIYVIHAFTYQPTISDKLLLKNNTSSADNLALPQVFNDNDLVRVQLAGKELVEAALEFLDRVFAPSRQLAKDARKVFGVIGSLEVAEDKLVGRMLL